jgi:hypothetical protein
MHPEPVVHVLHLILDRPNQALISNNKEIIQIQNNWGKDYATILIVMELQTVLGPHVMSRTQWR